MELPSKHVYLNELDDSDDEECLTHAKSPMSPPSVKMNPKPMSHRPFTVLIDQQLAKQQAALSTLESFSQSNHSRLQKSNEKETKEHLTTNTQALKINSVPSSSAVHKMWTGSSPKRTYVGVTASDKDLETVKHNTLSHLPSHSHPISDSFPSENLVSPEKAEIFSRFMHSQAQPDDIDQRQLSAGIPNAEKIKKDKNEVKGEWNGGQMDHQNLIERRRQKKKRRPPASYGIFHPPVMSSTQKSSEFGDYVNSSVNSDRKIVASVKEHGDRLGNNVANSASSSDEEGNNEQLLVTTDAGNKYEERLQKKGLIRNNNNNNNKIDEQDHVEGVYHDKENATATMSKSRRSHSHKRSTKLRTKSKVEFSDQLANDADHLSAMSEGHMNIDPDYMTYYKNVSKSSLHFFSLFVFFIKINFLFKLL